MKKRKSYLNPLPQRHLEYQTLFPQVLLCPHMTDWYFAEVPFIRVFAPALLISPHSGAICLCDSPCQTLESFVSHHQPTAAVSIFTPSLEMMPAMSCIVGPCPFPSQYPLYLYSSINLNSSLLIWKPLPNYHAAVLLPSILWFSALLFLLGHWSRIVVSEAC